MFAGVNLGARLTLPAGRIAKTSGIAINCPKAHPFIWDLSMPLAAAVPLYCFPSTGGRSWVGALQRASSESERGNSPQQQWMPVAACALGAARGPGSMCARGTRYPVCLQRPDKRNTKTMPSTPIRTKAKVLASKPKATSVRQPCVHRSPGDPRGLGFEPSIPANWHHSTALGSRAAHGMESLPSMYI